MIAKHLVEIAEETGADAIAHGATGKGNDQVRFELTANALNPGLKVIAPWREWDLRSRTALLDYAEKHQIPIAKDKRGEAPFSVDANLLHTSSEGMVLEDPAECRPPTTCAQRTVDPEQAPEPARDHHHRLREGRRGFGQRREALARRRSSPSSTSSAASTASAGSTWSRTASSA